MGTANGICAKSDSHHFAALVGKSEQQIAGALLYLRESSCEQQAPINRAVHVPEVGVGTLVSFKLEKDDAFGDQFAVAGQH